VGIGKYYFLILLLVPLLIITAPSAFAAEVIVQNAMGSSIPGCEETNECFIPYQVRINVGDTVTWINDDTAAHTATSGSSAGGPSGVFDSSLVLAGSSFSFTFNEAGTYPYHCMVHPWMAGVVIVADIEVELPPSIFVSTSRSTYDEGETIVISGKVTNHQPGKLATIQIFNVGNLVEIAQVALASDGSFTHTILAEGHLWNDDGTYQVRASYENVIDETNFIFNMKVKAETFSGFFEVNAGSSGTFDVEYIIRGGIVKNMIVDSEMSSLIVIIESTGDGSLTLDLPRGLIDATNSDGSDDNFFVLVNAEEVGFDESKTSRDRTLTISLSSGTREIEIIGTTVGTISEPTTFTPTPTYTPPIDPPPMVSTSKVTIMSGSSVPGCEESYRCYSPYSISVRTGTTVTWANVDSAAHTVTSGSAADGPDGIFDSSLLMGGTTFSHTFNNPGTFPYFDMLHPWMSGTVSVSGSSSPTPTPTIPSTPSIPPPTPVSTSRVIVEAGSSTPGCEEYYRCYTPYSVKIRPGITVTWANIDSAAHTVTSGTPADGPDGNFDSSLFMSGNTFEHMFDRAGTYPYFCMVHPWTIGEVVVSGTPVGTILTPTPIPTPTPTSSISVSIDRMSYSPDNIVNIDVQISGSGSGKNVGISVNDPTGSNLVSRTVTTDSRGSGEISFKLADNAMSGRYNVVATASVGGQNLKDTTTFTVESISGGVSILSLQPTDQQGNPVSSFSKGKLGFVKVVLSVESSVTSLVTINLFDSDLTSLGIGSFKTTLSPGQSEMVLSFFIPNDAVSGSANIYANAFSDWPSQGGIPLTGESSSRVSIR